MRWITLIFVACSASCYADIPEYKFNRYDIGSHIDVRVNSISDISLPLSILDNAKIAGIDGLVVIFKDKTAFSVETLSAKDLGYPELDMTLWPVFMLGHHVEGNFSPEFIEDVKRARKVLVDANKPYKTGSFKTTAGTCYLLIGKNKSSIYLTDNSNKDIITLITTLGMDESRIQKYLLQGVN
ncbi:MAG: hypothetical protein CSA49_01360 [Gammaproteobacteria bacterium]|nr:MAG: hypothetical protein CSA49_01360 [Gammaproteobacteria bacterium]